MTPSNPLPEFLAWCTRHGIIIDERLRVHWDVTVDGGISVQTQTRTQTRIRSTIEPATTVVQIPREAIMSVKTADMYEVQDSGVFGHGRAAQLALAVVLCVEIQKGVSSRWYGYLQSLPRADVDIPLFWGLDNSEPALDLLRGTEIERKLRARGATGLEMLDEFNAFFHETAGPLFDRYIGTRPDGGQFRRAFALVSSRAFLVDAYHGLAMVPIADAFNHSQENHVHLESEFDVCPECGSHDECPHDSPPPSSSSVSATSSVRPYYEMVTNTVVSPGEEVFNTYGEDLSNADLLIRYGFMSDVNENDRVSWDFTSEQASSLDLDWSAWEDLELVRVDEGPTPGFYIDSDGVVSHHLFLRVAGVTRQADLDELLIPRNGRLEKIVASITRLCVERRDKLANIDHLDVDEVTTRVKFVMLEIMSETSILESCISRWADLLER